MEKLSHINSQGNAHMVDISDKTVTKHTAKACGRIYMHAETLDRVRTGGIKKGDVLSVAQVAGIMAAKQTASLIPMCHPLPLSKIDLSFTFPSSGDCIEVTALVSCEAKTGVEMEALTAVSATCLTIYDMCKAVQKDMYIDGIRLLRKTGGKHDYTAAGTVRALCISGARGTVKHMIPSGELTTDWGIRGDAHGGNWHRQVSLLAEESVDGMRDRGVELPPGIFAENILTRGIDLKALPVGTRLSVGTAELEVTQIGKECHTDCAIRRKTGTCVMPTDGIFAVVRKNGTVRPGDAVAVIDETIV